jgi:hypothetical protein
MPNVQFPTDCLLTSDRNSIQKGEKKMSDIPLANAIADLRSELEKAIAEGVGHDIRFKPGPIELELSLEIKKEGSGKGSVKFWIVDLGGEIKSANAQMHKIKLNLQLVDKEGRDLLISGNVAGRPGG